MRYSPLNKASTEVPTFIDTILPSLSQPVFTFSLQTTTAGTFDLGYIDPSLYTGALTTVPVDPAAGDWFVSGIYFSVEGQNLSSASGTFELSFGKSQPPHFASLQARNGIQPHHTAPDRCCYLLTCSYSDTCYRYGRRVSLLQRRLGADLLQPRAELDHVPPARCVRVEVVLSVHGSAAGRDAAFQWHQRDGRHTRGGARWVEKRPWQRV